MAANSDSEIPSILRLARIQLLVATPLVLVLTWLRDGSIASAGSATLGCLIAFGVCNAFLYRALSRTRATVKSAEQTLLVLFGAELGKLLTAGILLGLSFKTIAQLDALPFIVAFCVAWFANSVLTAVAFDRSADESIDKHRTDLRTENRK